MISVEIRIVGNPVAVINGINRGETGRMEVGRGPECIYEWTAAVFPMHLQGPPTALYGSLKHWRGEGSVELARAMCAAFVKAAAKKAKADANKGVAKIDD
jgi:hypothetical protein